MTRNGNGRVPRGGQIALYAVLLLLTLTTLLPLLMVISRSVASQRSVLSGGVGLFPDWGDLHFDSYRYALENDRFIGALINTVAYTAIGTVIALVSTAGFAYALSKPWLRGRRFIVLLCLFVMVFSGGQIPTYLVMTRLKLVNTFHILYLAGAFSVPNTLILKSAFETIPRELEDAAIIDGAAQWTILWRIFLPLSRAAVAVIALLYAVDYWNNYYISMIYTTSLNLRSLQLVLKEIVYSASDVFLALHVGKNVGEVTSQSVTAACTVIAALPICLLYPFLQRNFTKGIMLGAVKG